MSSLLRNSTLETVFRHRFLDILQSGDILQSEELKKAVAPSKEKSSSVSEFRATIFPAPFFEPEVLQSGFEVTYLFGLAHIQKIARIFLSQFVSDFFPEFLSALFSRCFGAPQKITPEIHAQNCQYSSPISHF